MNKQIYIKWSPIEGDLEQLNCEGVHDDYEGFRVLLRSEKLNSKLLRVFFEAPLGYRNIDESDRLKTMEESSFDGHTFFTIENSEWLSWFNHENYQTKSNLKIIHYGIYTPNDCIDILSTNEPIFEWL